MGYWGIHRRHKDVRKETAEPDPPGRDRPGHRLPRSRRMQPRDALGRFRKAGRDDDFTPRPAEVISGPPGGPGRARRTTWRDFELDADLPRTPARTADEPRVAVADGRRHCGALENVIYRQWDARQGPPTPEVIRAVESLAELPDSLKEILGRELDGIYIGPGGVPGLDDMGHLKGVELPSGRATWDICAGAYGDRKIVVGDRPSPTPDVMMHEVGHALDDVDGPPGVWQSDTPEFVALYAQCLPHLIGDFHKQPAALGRREFFADAFAAIASRQRPALVDMLGGDTRTALNVMLYFNRRYGM